MLRQNRDVMHICYECKKSFGCAEHQRSHMVAHGTGKAYNCVQCQKSCGQAGHLKTHMVTQSKEKAYTCVWCQKSFGKTGNLKRHMLTHSGVKTHTCSECEKSFSLAQHLRMHMITHTLGKSTQMCRMWRYIWWGWAPETAHAHSQWREATHVHTMRLCMFTGNHSKRAHQNKFLTKGKSMQMVRLLFNHNILSQPTYTHPQRRKATAL